MAQFFCPEQHREILSSMDWLGPLAVREYAVLEPLARWLRDGRHGYNDIPPGLRNEVYFKDLATGEIRPCAQWLEWGWGASEMEGLNWLEKVHPEDRDSLKQSLTASGETGGVRVRHAVYRVIDQYGAYHWSFSSSAVIRWGSDGQPYRYLGRDFDIGSRIERELALRGNLLELENRAARDRALLEAAGRISGVTDTAELAAAVEASVPGIIGMDNFRLLVAAGMDVRLLLGSGLPEKIDANLIRQTLSEKGNSGVRCSTLILNADIYALWDLGDIPEGRAIAMLRGDAACTEDADRLMSVLGPIILRARERISGIDELRRYATTDLLTGAWNRRPFLDQAGRRLRRCMEDGSCATLVMLDIDHFKKVNDSCGHLRGDEVLTAVAAGMGGSLRPKDLMCRWGGEEFAVYLDGICGVDALKIVERIRAAAGRNGTAALSDTGLPLTLSAGIQAVTPDQPLQLTEALDLADKALLQAKRNGRNCSVADVLDYTVLY